MTFNIGFRLRCKSKLKFCDVFVPEIRYKFQQLRLTQIAEKSIC